MRESLALWLTPRGLQRLAQLVHKSDCLAHAEQAASTYIEVACKPLLSLKPEERADLASHVVRYAIAGDESRLKVALALLEVLDGNAATYLNFAGRFEEFISEFKASSAGVFAPNYIECFEMGARVYSKAIRRVASALPRLESTVTADKAPTWYEWRHVASCLDLCATAVLWYLDEGKKDRSKEIPQTLCVYVKELGLAHAAIVHELLSAPEEPRRKRQADLKGQDHTWDMEFLSLSLPDLRTHLSST